VLALRLLLLVVLARVMRTVCAKVVVNVDLVVHVFVMIKPCSSQFYLLHHFVSPSDNAESTQFISKLTNNDFTQLIGYDQFMMNHTYLTSQS
jgi:hypothetical protein